MRVLLCALVLAAVPLSAHSVLPTAFPEVVAQSSLIVRGRVTDVRAAISTPPMSVGRRPVISPAP